MLQSTIEDVDNKTKRTNKHVFFFTSTIYLAFPNSVSCFSSPSPIHDNFSSPSPLHENGSRDPNESVSYWIKINSGRTPQAKFPFSVYKKPFKNVFSPYLSHPTKLFFSFILVSLALFLYNWNILFYFLLVLWLTEELREAIPKPNHLLMFVHKVEFGINWVIRKGLHLIHPPSWTLSWCFGFFEHSLVLHNWDLAFSHDGFCIFSFWVLLKPAFLMGLVFTKWACAFLLCYYLKTSEVYSGKVNPLNFKVSFHALWPYPLFVLQKAMCWVSPIS